MKQAAIIVAGGTGTRMNAGIPKQFMLLAGEPLLMHTIKIFASYCPEMTLILVLPKKYFIEWEKLCLEYSFTIKHQLVEGGKTRFHSVRNALMYVHDDTFVAIHDGVRPLINASFISACFNEALAHGNAIPVLPLNDSLRLIYPGGSKPFDRSQLRLVQTPQVFSSVMIKKAYMADYQETFTDDATVLESSGGEIHLVAGLPENIKITIPFDLLIAETMLKNIIH